MIPRANITAWRSNDQLEQNLVISRALVSMFNHQVVADRLLFRGGTALHNLFFGVGSR